MNSSTNYLNSLLDPNTAPGALVLLAVAVAVAAVLSAFWHYGVRKLLERDTDRRIDRLVAAYFLQLGNVVLWIAVLTIYAHVIPALNHLGTVLLTGVSIASIIVGVAAQSTLGNMIAGIGLIFYKPFRFGDRVQIVPQGGSKPV